MKDKPWGSLLANALMGWLAFAIGWSAINKLQFAIVTDSIPYLFFNTSLYLFTTLPDIKGDRLSGKRTLAVIYGTEWLIFGAFILYLSGFVLSILHLDFQGRLYYRYFLQQYQ